MWVFLSVPVVPILETKKEDIFCCPFISFNKFLSEVKTRQVLTNVQRLYPIIRVFVRENCEISYFVHAFVWISHFPQSRPIKGYWELSFTRELILLIKDVETSKTIRASYYKYLILRKSNYALIMLMVKYEFLNESSNRILRFQIVTRYL